MSDKAPLSSLSIIRDRAKEIQYSCGFAASTSDYTVTRIMRPSPNGVTLSASRSPFVPAEGDAFAHVGLYPWRLLQSLRVGASAVANHKRIYYKITITLL